MNEYNYMSRLKERLLIEFKIQDRSGVYGYMQRSMAYNSNRIEGSTLTEKQTASMFDTGTLYSDDSDIIFRAKDIEEMNGHFKMFNYMVKELDVPLSNEIIKQMHKNLKEGVFEDFANGYAVGDWKQRRNTVSDLHVSEPEAVPEKMTQLLDSYLQKENIDVLDIAKFHADFENIHPFQDGNGRVGRIIVLKQCLDNNITPIVIRDVNKAEYYRCLNKAQHLSDYDSLVRYFEKEQDYFIEQTLSMLFTMDELKLSTPEKIQDVADDYDDFDGYDPADN